METQTRTIVDLTRGMDVNAIRAQIAAGKLTTGQAHATLNTQANKEGK